MKTLKLKITTSIYSHTQKLTNTVFPFYNCQSINYSHSPTQHMVTCIHTLTPSFIQTRMYECKKMNTLSFMHSLFSNPFSDFFQIKGIPRLNFFYSSRVLFFLFANPLKKQRSVLFGLLVCLSVKAVCFCSI